MMTVKGWKLIMLFEGNLDIFGLCKMKLRKSEIFLMEQNEGWEIQMVQIAL